MKSRGFLAALPLVLLATQRVEAQSYVVTQTSTADSGVNLDVYQLWIRFSGVTDTVLEVLNLTGLTAPVSYAFYHKDNSSYNGGVLSTQFGNWAPQLTGSATTNRPYDSWLVIGGEPTGVNTTNSGPGWNMAGLSGISNLGWFNANLANFQGRVGNTGNTATDVLLGQFVIDAGTSAGDWSLQTKWNDGGASSADQFYTGTFTLGPASGGTTTGGGGAVPEPGEWAAMGILGAGLAGLVIRKRRSQT